MWFLILIIVRIYRVEYTRGLQDEESDDEAQGREGDDDDAGSEDSTPRGYRTGGESRGGASTRPTTTASRATAVSSRPSTYAGGAEQVIEYGYGWAPDASMMELHPTIPALLFAARGVLAHYVENEVPQLARNAGYL